MPGTDFCVTYRQSSDEPALVASKLSEDPKRHSHEIEFVAQAWNAANDKARELGWMG
jgi:hypothetical protein